MIVTLGQRVGGVTPPPEFAEAVELYARKHERHGTLEFVPPINSWVVKLTPRSADPMAKLFNAGAEEAVEMVQLWRWDPKQKQYVGYTLDELGVSGLVGFLEKGNTWGRGEVKSHTDALNRHMAGQAKASEKAEADARQNAVDRGMEYRRQILEIPYHTVGVDLATAPTTAQE